MSISAGINTESKTKMKELIERKQTEATYIRKKIAEYATAIQQEIDTLTPFWLNSYIGQHTPPKMKRFRWGLGFVHQVFLAR